MEHPGQISVVTAGFEDLVDRGLRALLEEAPSVRLVRSGVPHDALAAALSEHEPAVAIANYGSLRGPLEVHELCSANRATRIIVLASRPSLREANELVGLGAAACLAKETQARDILSAIHLASRGLHVLPRQPSAARLPEAVEALTPREAEVMALLRDGRPNAEIAMILGVGVETVRTHARHVYRKLGIRSRRELAGPQLSRSV